MRQKKPPPTEPTRRERAILRDALLLAEQAVEAEADDLRRVVDRLGLHDADKAVAGRIKAANTKARAFSGLLADLVKSGWMEDE